MQDRVILPQRLQPSRGGLFCNQIFDGAKSCTVFTHFFYVEKIRINCDVAEFVDMLHFCKIATFPTFCVSERALLSPVPFENYQPSYVKSQKTDAKQMLKYSSTESYLHWEVIRPFGVLDVNHVIFLNERHSGSRRARHKVEKISSWRQACNVFLLTFPYVHQISTETKYIC